VAGQCALRGLRCNSLANLEVLRWLIFSAIKRIVREMLMNFRNIFAFVALFTLLGSVHASSCNFRTEITFQDGTKSCLEDFSIAKETPAGESGTVQDFVGKNHTFVLTRSKTPNCKAIGISGWSGFSGNASNKLAQLEKESLDKCFNAGCDCEVIISDHKARLSKDSLENWTSSSTAPSQMAIKNPVIEIASAPIKPLEVKDVPKINQNLSDTPKESEQIIALKGELEKLKTLLAKNLAKPEATAVVDTKKSAPQIYANRYALVIGNDSYQKIQALQNAKEDARAMAGNLDQLGYKTTLKLDLTEKQMRQELRSFKSQLKSGDEVTFYYAGHGVQIDSTNFLLPVDIAGDSEDQVKDEAISLQRVLDDMSEKKVKFTLALVDACRDNPFKGSGRSIARGRGLAPTTAATGQMIVFSAGTGQQALDRLGPNDKSKNGLFTRVFMSEMHKEGVSIDRIVRNVRTDVVALAKSVGHDQVPAIYDQVVGEFYFKK